MVQKHKASTLIFNLENRRFLILNLGPGPLFKKGVQISLTECHWPAFNFEASKTGKTVRAEFLAISKSIKTSIGFTTLDESSWDQSWAASPTAPLSALLVSPAINGLIAVDVKVGLKYLHLKTLKAIWFSFSFVYYFLRSEKRGLTLINSDTKLTKYCGVKNLVSSNV